MCVCVCITQFQYSTYSYLMTDAMTMENQCQVSSSSP
jgi:hypothetical protein